MNCLESFLKLVVCALCVLCCWSVDVRADVRGLGNSYYGILASQDSWVYIRGYNDIVLYNVQTGEARKVLLGQKEVEGVECFGEHLYAYAADTLHKYSWDFSEKLHTYIHHEPVLGVLGEEGRYTRFISRSGVYSIDRLQQNATTRVSVDSVSRFERHGDTGCIFTKAGKLVLLNIVTMNFEVLGSTVTVDQSSFVSVSDSLLCIGTPKTSQHGTQIEYWDLIDRTKIADSVYGSKYLPIAVVGRSVLKSMQAPRNGTLSTSEFELSQVGEDYIVNDTIELDRKIYSGISAAGAVGIGSSFITVGIHNYIGEIVLVGQHVLLHSYLSLSQHVLNFSSELNGVSGGNYALMSRTANGGLTWFPINYGQFDKQAISSQHIEDVLETHDGNIVAYTNTHIVVANRQMEVVAIETIHATHPSRVVRLPTDLYVRTSTNGWNTCEVQVSDDAINFQIAALCEKLSGEKGVAAFVQQDSIVVVTEQLNGELYTYRKRVLYRGEQVRMEVLGLGHQFRLMQTTTDVLSYSIFTSNNRTKLWREPLVEGTTTQLEIPLDSVFVSAVRYNADRWHMLDDHTGNKIEYQPSSSQYTIFEATSGVYGTTQAQFVSDSTVVINYGISVPMAINWNDVENITTGVSQYSNSPCILTGQFVSTVHRNANTLEIVVDNPCSEQINSVQFFAINGSRVGKMVAHVVSAHRIRIDIADSHLAAGSYIFVVETESGSLLHMPLFVEN